MCDFYNLIFFNLFVFDFFKIANVPDSKFKPISTFLTLPNSVSHISASYAGRIWYLLSLLGGNKSGQAQCVRDECEVWCGGVDGGHGMFVFEILCKHVFLWVCPTIMASHLCVCFSSSPTLSWSL